jgi:hypothetical protein
MITDDKSKVQFVTTLAVHICECRFVMKTILLMVTMSTLLLVVGGVEDTFKLPSSWSSYNINGTDGLDVRGFTGAATIGDQLFLAPYYTGSVVKHNASAAALNDPNSWMALNQTLTDGIITRGYQVCINKAIGNVLMMMMKIDFRHHLIAFTHSLFSLSTNRVSLVLSMVQSTIRHVLIKCPLVLAHIHTCFDTMHRCRSYRAASMHTTPTAAATSTKCRLGRSVEQRATMMASSIMLRPSIHRWYATTHPCRFGRPPVGVRTTYRARSVLCHPVC